MLVARRNSLAALLLSLTLSVSGAPAAEPATLAQPSVARMQIDGLHNSHRLGTNVYSGSTPENAAAFAALARLGVKTILSVDGAKPDVALARRHRLRYVHLPHGYDGISTNLQLRLATMAHTLPGPFYVHCHHGKHRGPAAAAVLCLASEGWTPAIAESWLKTAGTSTNYPGLYETIRNFRPPTSQQLAGTSATFPEAANVSGMVELMVAVDERWEHLQAVRHAGYQPPATHPDIRPVHEAVMLWEHFRELQRVPEAARRGPRFLSRLRQAEGEAKAMEELLRSFAATPTPSLRHRLNASFEAIAMSCSSCHQAFRD
jgi:hypothetical protein